MHQLTGIRSERSYVDQGYRGHRVTRTRVYQSRQRRGVIAAIKKELRRRSAIESIIGHLKNDCRLNRNYLWGSQGDAINASLAAVGFNFKQLLRWFRRLFWVCWKVGVEWLPHQFIGFSFSSLSF